LVAGKYLNLRALGYEHYDARLRRLGQSLEGAVTSTDGQITSRLDSFVSSVWPGFTTSGLQIGLHNGRLIYGFSQFLVRFCGYRPKIVRPRGSPANDFHQTDLTRWKPIWSSSPLAAKLWP
jgi:hypothetical protein